MHSLVEKNIPERLGSSSKERVWNLLTLLLLLGTVCLVASFALTFANPSNFLNPFPPQAAAFVDPGAATPTQAILPSSTPLPTAEPAVTDAPPPPAPTDAPADPAPTNVPATAAAPVMAADPTQAPAGPGGYPFQLRGDPIQVSSAISHAEQGCKWLGVGGEVFDLQSSPLVGLTIQMGGSLGGKSVNQLSLTGTATQYGPAGFEFGLGDKPLDSKGSLWLQLLDQAGLPLSDRVRIDTSSDCNKNLLLVNFKQVR